MPSVHATACAAYVIDSSMEKTNPADAPAFPLDLYDEPGHLIRRGNP